MMGGKTFVGNNDYKEDIAEVMNTGTHYYTLSYSPINQNWNGAYRRIHLDVPGYTPSSEWSLAKVFTEPNDTKVEYRRGYNAVDALRRQPDIPGWDSADVDTEPAQPKQHRLLTDPRRRGKPQNLSSPIMRAAMQFGSPTPVQLPFTVTVTPSPEVVEGKPGTAPPDSFLDPHFQGKPYRNYRIHYSVDPESLKFVKNPDGSFSDGLRFVAVLYTDDGFEVNSIATPGRTAGDAQEYGRMMKAPFSFDQTIAVPTEGFFYLRVGVHEFGSDHIGAIEIPIDALKPSLQNTSADGATDRTPRLTPNASGAPSFAALGEGWDVKPQPGAFAFLRAPPRSPRPSFPNPQSLQAIPTPKLFFTLLLSKIACQAPKPTKKPITPTPSTR